MTVIPVDHWNGIIERKLQLEKREFEFLGGFRKKLKIKQMKPQLARGKR